MSEVARWPSRQFRAGREARKETRAGGLPDMHRVTTARDPRREPSPGEKDKIQRGGAESQRSAEKN